MTFHRLIVMSASHGRRRTDRQAGADAGKEVENGATTRTSLSRAGPKAGSGPTCTAWIYKVWREVGPRGIQWNDGMSGEVTASGIITADMTGSDFGWLQINMDNFQQSVELILMPRHFGGGQWYFVCSELNRPASVLWRPPGALFFRCRQYWGRRVAYLCQFGNPIDRAHIGRAKLKAKLCSRNLDDWRIPPKPPNMRWATYDRLIGQYLKYDAVLGGVPIQQISNA